MRPSIRLSSLHRWALYISWLVISFSGLYFAYAQDWQMQEPSDLTVNTLKLHGIAAAVMLIIIGSLLSMHIKLALHRKRNLITGIITLSTMLVLALSGTGLYYSPESWHETTKWLHIWLGIACIVVLPAHIILGRRSRLTPH